MALSPNYQWAEPDNSSLVKNGAQDIRALGDAIDTSVWNVGYGQAGKNAIINGNFGIWQRGTSFTPATSGFGADRWFCDSTTAFPTSQTLSQQTFTPGTAPVAGYEGQFFLRFAYTYAPGNGGTFIGQKIEDVRTFAGHTATVSFWAKVASAATLGINLVQNFGSGGSGAVTTAVGSPSATTSWQRFSYSVSVPSISGKTVGTSSFLELRIVVPTTSSTTDIWGVQVEYGSKATPFQTATGTLQGELAACQRYYFDGRQGSDQAFSGYTIGTDYLLAMVRYPVTMRTTPSVTIGQSSGVNYVRRISTNGQLAITVSSYPGSTPGGFSAVYAAASPFASGVGYDFYILASAEL
jgi:hypothetical protein